MYIYIYIYRDKERENILYILYYIFLTYLFGDNYFVITAQTMPPDHAAAPSGNDCVCIRLLITC